MTDVAPTTPDEALARLVGAIEPVGSERLPLELVTGRVLADATETDRDSPALDLSAMDGYAVRAGDVAAAPLPLSGDALIGTAPGILPPGSAFTIVTGAPLPAGADAVVPVEDAAVDAGRVALRPGVTAPSAGRFVRRRGENGSVGTPLLQAGSVITAPARLALATFGHDPVTVYRRVRLALIVTGDELVHGEPAPWQLRDGNGPALRSLAAGVPWLELVHSDHATDDAAVVRDKLAAALDVADVVWLTGGVSMGPTDHVPGSVTAVGASTLFHRLPMRPGRPLLAAVGPAGQAILGYPGNPLSALITARRFGIAAARRRAGFVDPVEARPRVQLSASHRNDSRFFRQPPVRLLPDGSAHLLPVQSSGDVVGPAAATGFVVIPPGVDASGPFEYWDFQP